MGKREIRSQSAIRFDAFKRMLHWHVLSGLKSHCLVAEYPKSGGSWVSQLISDYLEIPFPRNQSISLFQSRSLLHGHHSYSSSFKNAVYLLRDGRDVMTSAYYHCLFHNDRNPKQMVEGHRQKLPLDDYENVYENMPTFIEYMFEVDANRKFRFSWTEFVNSINYDKAMVVKYEDLVADTAAGIGPILEKLSGKPIDDEKLAAIVHKYSFKNQVKRESGEEDKTSFLRKGVAGDWKNKFSPLARETFEKFGGDALILAGYETDRSWVQST